MLSIWVCARDGGEGRRGVGKAGASGEGGARHCRGRRRGPRDTGIPPCLQASEPSPAWETLDASMPVPRPSLTTPLMSVCLCLLTTFFTGLITTLHFSFIRWLEF